MASERGVTDNIVQILFKGNNLLDILYILYSVTTTQRAYAASIALGENKINYLYSPYFKRNYVQQQLINYVYQYITKIVNQETFWATYSNTVRAVRRIVDNNYFRDRDNSFLSDPYNLELTANVAYQDKPYNKTTTVTMVEGGIYGSFKSGGVITPDFVTRRKYYNIYNPGDTGFNTSLNLDYKPPTVFDLSEFVKPKSTVRKVASFMQKKYIVGAFFDPEIMAAATDVTVTEGEEVDLFEELDELIESGEITEDEFDFLVQELQEELEEEADGPEQLARSFGATSEQNRNRRLINAALRAEFAQTKGASVSKKEIVYNFRYNPKKAEQIVGKLNNRVNKKTFGLLLKADESKKQITSGGLFSITNTEEGQYNLPVFQFQGLSSSFNNFLKQTYNNFDYPNLYTYF